MSFLAPLWLLLAGAAAVPLLIHLLRRRIGTRVDFPAARYLARAEREHSRKLRLRNLLLMMLRVLVIAFLALAAARPIGRVAGPGHAPTALAVVLDNSLSTSAVVDGRPVLDRLKEAARSALVRATAADRVWLVTADGKVVGGTPTAVAAAVGRVEPLAGTGGLEQALARAAGLARSSGLNAREVAVLTDAQATTWRRPVSLGEVSVSLFAPGGTPPANHAVTDVRAEPVRWTPRGLVRARVLTPGDSATYRVTLRAAGGESRTLARGTAAAAGGTGAAGAAAELTVHASPPERGWTAGTVELEPDELRGDDVRHFAVWIGAPTAVALTPGAGPFAQSAVAALVQSGRITTAAGGGVSVGPADEITRLPALILAPSTPVRLGAANRALERLGVPWRFGAPAGDSAVARWTGSAARQGADSAGRAAGPATRVTRRFALAPRTGPASDTLARVGASPWIVSGPGYVIVGSPLDPVATDLPVRAAFVPWLAEAVTLRLSAEGGGVIEAAPGRPMRRPAWADALETPTRERLPVGDATTSAPGRSGAYFLLRGGQRVGALVVNGEPDESALGRLTPEELSARVQARAVRVHQAPEQWLAALFDASTRRPLVVPFLLAALVALVAESLMARGARTSRPSAGAA